MTTGLTLTKAEAVEQLKHVVGIFFKNYKEDDEIDSGSDNKLCRDNERLAKQYYYDTMGVDPDKQRLGGFNEGDYKYFVDHLPMWDIGGRETRFDCLLRNGEWSKWFNVSEPCTGKHAICLPNLI